MTAQKRTRRILLGVVLFLNVIALSLVLLSTNKRATETEAWYSSSWFYRRAVEIPLAIDQDPRMGENVLITLDTASLISAGKMQSDCDDLRIVDSDDSSALSYWVEGGCNTSATQIWVYVPYIPGGGKTIYVYYGNAAATNSEIAWSGKFVLMSDTSCPTGWTRESAFDNRFPKVTGSYGTTGSGVTSHTHNVSLTTGGPSGSSILATSAFTGTNFATPSHTHSISGSTDSFTMYPPYLKTYFCSNSDLNITSNLITPFTTSLPSGWTHFSALDNRFPMGSNSYGSTGGTTSHTHGNSTLLSEAIVSSFFADTGTQLMTGSTSIMTGHRHGISSATINSATNTPSYYTVNYAEAGSTSASRSEMISIANALPPLGWSAFSSANNKMLMGSSTAGSTGGSDSHTHSISITTTSETITSSSTAEPPFKIDTSTRGSHTHSASGNSASVSNFPPYVEVALYKRNTSITTTVSSTEEIENTTPNAPTSLQTEGYTNPNRVTDTTPEFSAIFSDTDSGDTGNYYEIEVNTNSSFTGTVMWDSGKQSISSITNGARSSLVTYNGTSLSLNGTTYYWRIRFWDNNDAVSAWSSTANFRMNTIPSAPSSLSVEGITAGNPTQVADVTPELSATYSDPDGDSANAYEIEVNTNSSFTGTVMWDTGLVSNSLTSGSQLPEVSYNGTALTEDGSTYYWRIRFRDVNGSIGSWSATGKAFTMNYKPSKPSDLKTETLTNPTGVMDLTPDFSGVFNDNNGVGESTHYYELEVNTTSSFTGTVMWDSGMVAHGINEGDTLNVVYAGSPLSLDSSTYYWRLRFWDSVDSVSDWSDTAQFTMNGIPNLPQDLQTNGLTTPSGVTTGQPELSAVYSDPDGDALSTFRVLLYDDGDTLIFDSLESSILPTVTSGSRVGFSPEGPPLPLDLDGETYTWWIKFTDENGSSSDWSTGEFTMNSTPSAPSSLETEGSTNPTQITDLTPEFSAIFSDEIGDTGNYYEIEVNTNSSFTGTVMWDSGKTALTNVPNLSRSQDITYDGTALSLDGSTYYWRMKFWDNHDTESDWSTTNSFSMNGTGDTPTNLLVNDSSNPTGVMDTIPEFSALFSDPDSGDTATSYQIQVSTYSDMSSIDVWDSTQTSFGPLSNNTQSENITYTGGYTISIDGETYYWRIRFWDDNGTPTPWSSINFFKMNNPPSYPSKPEVEGIQQNSVSGVTDLTPEFSAIYNDYDSGDTATHYEIEVNTNNTFTGTVMWDSGQTLITPLPPIPAASRSADISYAGISLSLDGSTYYWRIRFWDDKGSTGNWSSTYDFTMNTAPSTPSGLLTEGSTNPTGVVDLTPEFSAVFSDPNGDTATHYEIEVAGKSGFDDYIFWDSGMLALTTPITSGNRSEDISYAGDVLNYNYSGTNTTYWRIKFWDENGTESGWSSTNSFVMNSKPAIYDLQVEQSNNPTGIGDTTPEFSARYYDGDSEQSSAYQIVVNTSADFTGTQMWDSGKTAMTPINTNTRTLEIPYAGTSLSIETGLTYYWKMKFWDSNDIEGEWQMYPSTTSSNVFTMNSAPSSPAFLETEGETNPTSVLDLTPEFSSVFVDPDITDTARAYYIQVNTSDDFTGTMYWDAHVLLGVQVANNARIPDITYNSTATGTPLSFDGSTYYWRMKYVDNKNVQGAWSSANSFTMADQPEAPTSLSSVALSTTSIRWGFTDNSDNELGFKLYDGDDNLIKTCVGENINYCDETGLDSNTQYTRYVVAYNSEIESNPSNEDSRYTLSEVPDVIYGGNKTSSSIDLLITEELNGAEVFFHCLDSACNTNLEIWTTDLNPTVTSLEHNTGYNFTARSRNGDGVESSFSSPITLYTLSDVPTLTVTPASSSSLTLTAGNVNNASLGSSGLFFDCTDSSCDTGINSWVQSVNGLSTGLEPNNEYTFRVKSRNFDGLESTYSSEVSEYTDAVIPSISQINAVNSSEVSISIESNGNPSYTDISIEDKVSGKYVNPSTGLLQESIVWVGYSALSLPLSVTSLDSGTTYSFVVEARSENGNLSGESAQQSVTTLLETVSATSPTVESDSSITWNIGSYSDSITGIKVYDVDGNLQKTCLGSDINSCTEDSLQPDAEYSRKITIFNDSAESEYSNIVSARTYASAPVLPEFSGYTDSSVSLRVDRGSNPDGTEYVVEEVNSGTFFDINTELLQGSELGFSYKELGEMSGFTVHGLDSNSEYIFRVKAINGDDIDSAWSNERSVVTLSEIPEIVTVSSVSSSSLALNIDVLGNSSSTEILIKETDSNRYYDNSTKSLGTTPIWFAISSISDIENVLVNGLEVNTGYSFCIQSRNSDGIETECSDVLTGTTLSNVITLSGRTISSSSLELTVNVGDNNEETSYQIADVDRSGYITSASTLSNTVSILSNDLVSSPLRINNLPPNTAYTFRVRSLNSEDIGSTWSQVISLVTWANLPRNVEFTSQSGSTGKILFGSNSNPYGTQYAVQDIESGKYVDYSNKTLTENIVWGNYASWGSDKGIVIEGLDSGTSYTFRVKARNSAGVQTAYVESNTGNTYSIIINKPEEISTSLTDDIGVDVSDISGAQTGTKQIRVMSNEYILADIPVEFSQNRDWSNVVMLSDNENSKSVVKVDDTHGFDGTFTLYTVANELDNSYRICPDAITLEDVTSECTNGVLFSGDFPKTESVEENDVTVSKVSLGGVVYWVADGLVGTGGMGESVEVESVIPTPEIIQNITRSVTETTENVNKAVEGVIINTVSLLDNTALGELKQEELTTVAATTTVITVSVGMTSLGGLSQLVYTIGQIFINLLTTLGLRRKRQTSGLVYNSVTRSPIPQAIIRIYDVKKKLIETAVTDIDGVFWTSVNTGNYLFDVRKRGFSFPSKLILGKEDYPLTNVYHGEKTHIKKGELSMVIPMDPKKIRSVSSLSTVIRSVASIALPILNILLYVSGIAITVYMYVKFPMSSTLLIGILYIPATFILIRSLFDIKLYAGRIHYSDGSKAANVEVLLRENEFDRVIAKRVTDDKGRYSFDIKEKGSYSVEFVDKQLKVVKGNSEINVRTNRKRYVRRKLVIERK